MVHSSTVISVRSFLLEVLFRCLSCRISHHQLCVKQQRSDGNIVHQAVQCIVAAFSADDLYRCADDSAVDLYDLYGIYELQ